MRILKCQNRVSGHKQFQSLKSEQMRKSNDNSMIDEFESPSVGMNSVNLGASNIYGGRKSSFEIINFAHNELKSSIESERLPPNQFRNSLDILASNINKGPQTPAPLRNIIQIYNDQNKQKIEQQGHRPLQIGEVQSESEEPDYGLGGMPQQERQRGIIEQKDSNCYRSVLPIAKFDYHSYFPQELADVLKERQIPVQYVKGMLLVKDQKQIKTTRRLKVERYLQKRRKKTWNRKICYNCRQKVAEQRLRIKGKFIKKRRAMEILGMTIPIETAQLKVRLYAALKDKSNTEIMEIINGGKNISESGSESELQGSEKKEEQVDDSES